MREKITHAALSAFDRLGYYRTGIRDIAGAAGCSLPTLYYYFKNKEALFDTVVCDAYEALVVQIEDQIPLGLPLIDIVYFTVMQKCMLEGDNKLIYRLALKTLMGMDGHEEAQVRLRAFDESRGTRPAAADSPFAALLRLVEAQLLQEAILKDTIVEGEKLLQQLGLLFSLAEGEM